MSPSRAGILFRNKGGIFMKEAYPIVIQRDDDFLIVHVPDFDIDTQGESLVEAIEMARDAIGACGCYMQDKKQPVPLPSDIASVSHDADEFVTLVDVDFDEYRRKSEMRTVRKNITLPSWLNYEAEHAGVNFSAVLQKALKETLHITDR